MRKKLKYLSIFLLLFIIFVSSTYAFYVAVVDKNGDGGDVSVTTKRLSMSFTDGPQIEIDGILPGATIIKTFSVNNSSSGEMTYSISFEDVINELSRTDDLVYTLTSTNNGASINETSFPTSDEVIVANQTIAANTTHEYTLTIQYKNLGVDQADDMGKVVSATIVVGQNEDTAALAPGLYNANNELIMSYDDLVSTYNFNPEQDLTAAPSINNGNCTVSGVNMNDQGVPACVLTNFSSDSNLILPTTISKIGDYSFYGIKIRSISLPDSITTIGTKVFNNNSNVTNIESLTMPDSVTTIDQNSLCGVKILNYNGSLNNPNGANWKALYLNPYIEDDFVYTDNTKKIVIGYLGKNNNITIPNYVTEIGKNAFINNSQINQVLFENDSSLGVIDKYAFAYSNISTINIPGSVTYINAYAFSESNLSSISFNNYNESSNLYISNFAFYKTKIQSIIIPKRTYSIGYWAFSETSTLSSLAFENNCKLSSISQYAFSQTSITSLTIPRSVKIIANDAFYNIPTLTSVTFESNSKINDIYQGAFVSTGITSITLPASLSEIRTDTFYGCNSLTSVTFENTVGWKDYEYDWSDGVDLDVTDPSSNATRLKIGSGTIHSWKRTKN